MNHNYKPKVSIGLPVYNGEQFLRETLDSILAQTYKDFELVISDNASTDKTQVICREYAFKDRRIRYYRNDENLGAAPNYNLVYKMAEGEYFKWAAHDDLLAPEFLEKCVEILDKNTSVILCHSKVRLINKLGSVIEKKDPLYIKTCNVKLNTNSPKLQERFRDLILVPHPCYQVFGLIRSSILSETSLIDRYSGSDRVLLARLGLLGQFYEIPEYLFFPRRHSKQSINIVLSRDSKHLYTEWFDSSKKRRIVFPTWKIFREYLLSIQKISTCREERFACYRHMMNWLQWRWKGMIIREPVIAIRQILSNIYPSFITSREKYLR